MYYLWWLFLIFFPIGFKCIYADIISLYSVKYIEKEPYIDGILNDECWKQVEFTDRFYVYLSKKPISPEFKTSFGMFYNENGIYIGIVNYDENVDKIRTSRYVRDDPLLWMDDCNEIYIDPEGKGIGYTKFITTFNGTKYDEKRTDTQVTDVGWNGENWIYKTSKEQDRWIVEIFIPWSDIGRKAMVNDLWKFNINRYCYTTGKSWFAGASWSFGASYLNPEKFGFLFFTGQEVPRMEKICDLLSKTLLPGWIVPYGKFLFIGKEKGQWTKEEIDGIFKKEYQQAREKMSRVDDIIIDFGNNKKIQDEYEALKHQLENTPEDTHFIGDIDEMINIKEKIDDFYWKLRLEKDYK
ncbi:MAG: sugar-binding protein [Candidatus Ratteibacteria bacterium]